MHLWPIMEIRCRSLLRGLHWWYEGFALVVWGLGSLFSEEKDAYKNGGSAHG